MSRDKDDRELDNEVRAYLALLTDEKVASGMDPTAARRAALIELDGVELVKERVREQRRLAWLEQARQDARYTLRLLRRDFAFTSVVVLTLAICIGANTALFSVIHNVLLRPLPVPESDRILVMENVYPKAGAGTGGASVPDYYDRLRETTVFEEQALYNSSNVSLDQNGTPTRIRVTNVTPSFFRLLRVRPLLGRTFDEAEGEPGSEKKIVLSYALWQTQFGGDQNVVGRDLRIDGRLYTIVGVMPRDFFFLNPGVMLWRPLAFTAALKSDDRRHSNNWQEIGRLKPGQTLERAQSQIEALNAAKLDRFPHGDPHALANAVRTAINGIDRELPVFDTLTMDERMEKSLVSRRSPVLLSLGFGAVALLLSAIGIYGVLAYLVTQRSKEIGIRIALGSSAGAIVELVLREGLMLIGIGFALGGVGAVALRKGLETQLFGVRASDPIVLATVTSILALVALAACAVPARRATKIDPIIALGE
jgi:hypothetical protein